MARYTRTVKHTGGCSTSQTTIFMTTETSDHATKMLDESKQHRRRIFIGQRSGAYEPGAPAEQT